ncbi:MAG: hypothetical protein RID53_23370 [Coleofasciculus sp. B1-GNL1-01]|uniref:hypothetical protein n=1 Tax=Coleofasciculus sp. B1-GNL1-01 TaxID=3068484 RepID=UPI003304F2E6
MLAVPRRHRALAQLNAPKYCHTEPQHGALRRLCIEIIKVNPPMRLTHPTNTTNERALRRSHSLSNLNLASFRCNLNN